MNLVDILKTRIESVGKGAHSVGFKAVLLHVETAVAHRERGIVTGDDSAFTDTVYRTNQAFEGGLKEGYRVISNKNPDHKTPNEIEKYLANNNIFRGRVLSQFKHYRTEWRNPSIHDHKLDFDANEALLAIIAVCGFAIVLLDQMLEKLAHDKILSERAIERDLVLKALSDHKSDPLAYVSNLIAIFMDKYVPLNSSGYTDEYHIIGWVGLVLDAEIVGALRGFVELINPDIKIYTEIPQINSKSIRADLVLEVLGDKILVEFKSTYHSSDAVMSGKNQIEKILSDSNNSSSEWKISLGTLVIFTSENTPVRVIELDSNSESRIMLVGRNLKGN